MSNVELVFTNDGKERKDVFVHTTVPTVLYPFQLHDYASGGYLAIPKQVLSKMYIVPSFKVHAHRSIAKCLIGIVATTIEIPAVQIKLRFLNINTH